MYRIDTGQARTDLYGIGKGAAQVLDLTPMREQNKANAIAEERKLASKQKIEADKDSDIQNQMSKMGAVKIMPRDQEIIAGKGQAVRDYVVKNIGKLRKGDATTTMGFQQLMGDYQTSADMSQNAREDWEKTGTEMMKDPDAYRPESLQHYFDFASKDQAGNFALDKTKIKKNENYNDRVMKVLSPYSERQATQTGRVKDYSLEEAEQLIVDDLTDQNNFEQAAYDFGKASKAELSSLGNPEDPSEYYKKKYAPKIVAHNVGPAPQGRVQSASSGGSTKTPISGVLTKNADGRYVLSFDTDKQVDNPWLTFIDPETGKTVEGKPLRIIYNKDETEAPKMIVAIKPNPDQKIKGGEMEVRWNEAQSTMSNKYGLENMYAPLYKNEPSNWRINRPEESEQKETPKGTVIGKSMSDQERAKEQKDWNSKWASLNKGETLVGLDGKTYKK